MLTSEQLLTLEIRKRFASSVAEEILSAPEYATLAGLILTRCEVTGEDPGDVLELVDRVGLAFVTETARTSAARLKSKVLYLQDVVGTCMIQYRQV